MAYSYIKCIKYINIISIYTIHNKLHILNAKIKCISFAFCLLELNFIICTHLKIAFSAHLVNSY